MISDKLHSYSVDPDGGYVRDDGVKLTSEEFVSGIDPTKRTLATLIEELDALVRAATPDDRKLESCVDLADKVVAHWDELLKPTLRKLL